MSTNSYDFDAILDRSGTGSIKWDYGQWCPDRDDVLPMWVADMDFRSPSPVIDALKNAVDHGVFGYTLLPKSALECVVAWCSKRYRWTLSPSHLSFSPGVVTALNVAIQAYTNPGDRVVIQAPVYPPFFSAVNHNNRELVVNQLVVGRNGTYGIDFESLRASIDHRTKLLVLCNPHNPVGRVWTVDELQQLAQIAIEFDLLVFSDDIHADLVFQPNTHVPIASLGSEIADRTVTAIAPSKTFNIPGLQASIVIATNPQHQRSFDQTQERVFGHVTPNSFAAVAIEAAYGRSEHWLEAVLEYLKRNRETAVQFIRNQLSDVTVPEPEATYLLWLDFSAYAREHDLSNDDVRKLLYCTAGVALNDGRTFGPGGDMHFRLNFGCPASMLQNGLNRIASALTR